MYVYIYIYIYTCIYLYIFPYTYIYIYIFIHTHTHLHSHTHTYAYIRIYVNMYIYRYRCKYVQTCMYACTRIPVYTLSFCLMLSHKHHTQQCHGKQKKKTCLQIPHDSSSAFQVHVDTACHSSISTFILHVSASHPCSVHSTTSAPARALDQSHNRCVAPGLSENVGSTVLATKRGVAGRGRWCS